MNTREQASDRRGVASMQDAMRAFLRETGLSQHMSQWPVFEAWTQAVGRDMARRARPVQFTRGQLCIEVDSAAHLHELMNFTGERFRELANARLRDKAGADQREKADTPSDSSTKSSPSASSDGSQQQGSQRQGSQRRGVGDDWRAQPDQGLRKNVGVSQRGDAGRPEIQRVVFRLKR